MKTLDEVRWYCKEQNPVGALLITGKWGCGKTYLIEHIIPECSEISSEYAVVRVSLFGETSVESIHKKVKHAYITCRYFEDNTTDNQSEDTPKKSSNKRKLQKGLNYAGKGIIGITDIIGKFFPAGEAASAILSLNWLDFIEVSAKIGKRKLLLIFDDLERCNMQIQDLLGALNEYVETKKIKTILIADEEKITSRLESESLNGTKDDQELPYSTLKEKIVSRTVKHIPEYEVIVSNIISNYIHTECNYKEFLLANIAIIHRAFRNSDTSNIRSLKCAIQDFERVFGHINNFEFSDDIKRNFFGSFLALEFEAKDDNLKNDGYGYLLANVGLSEKYRDFQSRFVLESCRHWITTGEWIHEDVNNELQEYVNKLRSEEIEDIVIRSQIIDLEDTVFETGFPIVLNKAYEGLLDLDGYISLLQMRLQARSFDIAFPVDADLLKIHEGLIQRISDIKRGVIEEQRGHLYVVDENVESFSSDEAKIYATIQDFRDYEQHYKNKAIFIDSLKNKNDKAIYECFSKYYKSFDEELAIQVYSYYKELDNSSKRFFCAEFLRAWKNTHHSTKSDVQETIIGLGKLSTFIEATCEKGNIKGAIDRAFIKNLKTAIKAYETLTNDFDFADQE